MEVLPSFMAVDVREPKDIMTALPSKAAPNVSRISTFSGLQIKVEQMFGRAGTSTGSNTDGLIPRLRHLNRRNLYGFYGQPEAGRAEQVYFGFENDQALRSSSIARLPIAWSGHFKQCGTEDGRMAYLDELLSSCRRLQNLHKTIIRDRSHV